MSTFVEKHLLIDIIDDEVTNVCLPLLSLLFLLFNFCAKPNSFHSPFFRPSILVSVHHSLYSLVIKRQINLQSSLIIDEQKKPWLFRFLSAALIEPLTFTLTQLLFTQMADGRTSQKHSKRGKARHVQQMHHVYGLMHTNKRACELHGKKSTQT